MFRRESVTCQMMAQSKRISETGAVTWKFRTDLGDSCLRCKINCNTLNHPTKMRCLIATLAMYLQKTCWKELLCTTTLCTNAKVLTNLYRTGD